MEPERWTIYCHTHVDSGRRYIGLTKQAMMKRWKNHVHAAQHSRDGRWHFPNARNPANFRYVTSKHISLNASISREYWWADTFPFPEKKASRMSFMLPPGFVNTKNTRWPCLLRLSSSQPDIFRKAAK